MRPRGFFSSASSIGPRRTGGEIFSKLKAGIVYPLVVELRHLGVSRKLSFDITVTENIRSRQRGRAFATSYAKLHGMAPAWRFHTR